MQKDWKRDPIWQLVGVIISIDVTLITQFNDTLLKIIIAAVGFIVCGCLFFSKGQINTWKSKKIFQRSSKLAKVVAVLIGLVAAFVFFSLIFFIGIGLFALGDLWEHATGVIVCVLALSAATAIIHREDRHSFIVNVLLYSCPLFGIVGIVLMISIDRLIIKIISGIWTVFAFSISFADFEAARVHTSIRKEMIRSLCSFSTLLGIILIIVVNNPWGKFAWGIGSILVAFIVAVVAASKTAPPENTSQQKQVLVALEKATEPPSDAQGEFQDMEKA
jgi:hypothetical protein